MKGRIAIAMQFLETLTATPWRCASKTCKLQFRNWLAGK